MGRGVLTDADVNRHPLLVLDVESSPGGTLVGGSGGLAAAVGQFLSFVRSERNLQQVAPAVELDERKIIYDAQRNPDPQTDLLALVRGEAKERRLDGQLGERQGDHSHEIQRVLDRAVEKHLVVAIAGLVEDVVGAGPVEDAGHRKGKKPHEEKVAEAEENVGEHVVARFGKAVVKGVFVPELVGDDAGEQDEGNDHQWNGEPQRELGEVVSVRKIARAKGHNLVHRESRRWEGSR
jgi:hypothetical protein